MKFSSIALSYLAELSRMTKQAVDTGELTPELSYRPATNRFLFELCRSISSNSEIVFEPKKQANAGRPDWRLYDGKTYGVYGYVEAKGIDLNSHLDPEQHQHQVERYLTLGSKVILTDGLDFLFFDPKERTPSLVSLVSKPIEQISLSKATVNSNLDTAFRRFLQEPSFRVTSELSLIQESARRAKQLADEIKTIAETPLLAGLTEEENETISVIQELKEVLERHHDQTLNSPKVFGDFVAQVLIFGLLYAHRVVSLDGDTPAIRDEKIKTFWTNLVYANKVAKLKPFAALVGLLGQELNSLGPLGTWYTDCRLMLAHTDLHATSGVEPDFHRLYEQFLEAFDRKIKFDFGAFYTPRPLADFALRLTETILQKTFPERSLYESSSRLIDPCCGTGTFVELLLKHALSVGTTPKISGFEILPAPYALAHYRLEMLDSAWADMTGVNIVLTNTLSDALQKAPSEDSDMNPAKQIIIAEQQRAREIASPPLMLVIGNPPSSDSPKRGDLRHFRIIETLLEDFRPSASQRHSRQNIQKQLQNEFVLFLRWACQRLELNAGLGMLCFLMPNTVLSHPSYAYARKRLLSTFGHIWALDIDEDVRRGIQTDSLFATQQGRCLLIGIRADSAKATGEVRYKTIARLPREEKLKEIVASDLASQLASYDRVLPTEQNDYSFHPASAYDEDLYLDFWPLCPPSHDDANPAFVFSRHCSGIKLAPSNLLIHTNKALLLRRSKEVAESSQYDLIKQRWFSGQKKPPSAAKMTDAVKAALKSAVANDTSVHVYAYRPFLHLFALLDQSVLDALKTTEGAGTRARPEVLRAFGKDTVLGIAVSPSPKEISGSLHRFASFCWGPPDNDLTSRGNAHIFCNFFPEYKKARERAVGPVKSNVNQKLIEALGIQRLPEPETSVTFYCYAVLTSNLLLKHFEGALFSVGNWPRIPFPKDPTVFERLAELGKQLAILEKPVSTQANDVEFAEWTDFKFTEAVLEKDTNSVRFFSGKENVYSINDVGLDVLSFQIAGYGVLQEWLKFHTYPYSRSTFRKSDAIAVNDLIDKVRKQIAISSEIDKMMSFAKNPHELIAAPAPVLP